MPNLTRATAVRLDEVEMVPILISTESGYVLRITINTLISCWVTVTVIAWHEVTCVKQGQMAVIWGIRAGSCHCKHKTFRHQDHQVYLNIAPTLGELIGRVGLNVVVIPIIWISMFCFVKITETNYVSLFSDHAWWGLSWEYPLAHPFNPQSTYLARDFT